MANRFSRLQPKPSQTKPTKSGIGNPNSSKISQTGNAFLNRGKTSTFSRSGLVENFAGTRVLGASGPLPPPPPPPFSFSLTLNSSSAVIGNDTVLSFTGSVVSSPSSSFELYFISGSNKYSATPNNSNFVGGTGSIVFSGIPVESASPYLVFSSVQVVDISQDLTVDFTASIQDTGESDPASTVGDSFATSLFDVVYSLSTYDAFVARTTTAGATQENLVQISSSFLPNIESQTL